MSDRVRGVLITPAGGLLTIRRTRPGQPPYWVFPGGGVEVGESDLEALRRELREELAATGDIQKVLWVVDVGDTRQAFYLVRVESWSSDPHDRSGPEVRVPSQGEYVAEVIPLAADALRSIDLRPNPVRDLLVGALHRDGSTFS
jgi:8-oxo-dGTP pyrophosphatase MutT (NUDIX family)